MKKRTLADMEIALSELNTLTDRLKSMRDSEEGSETARKLSIAITSAQKLRAWLFMIRLDGSEGKDDEG